MVRNESFLGLTLGRIILIDYLIREHSVITSMEAEIYFFAILNMSECVVRALPF